MHSQSCLYISVNCYTAIAFLFQRKVLAIKVYLIIIIILITICVTIDNLMHKELKEMHNIDMFCRNISPHPYILCINCAEPVTNNPYCLYFLLPARQMFKY